MLVINGSSDIAKAINRSKLVRQQKQVIRNGKAVTTYVWVNPDKNKTKVSRRKITDEELDAARKTLAPITYEDDGTIIPLSQRFNKASDDIRKSLLFKLNAQ